MISNSETYLSEHKTLFMRTLSENESRSYELFFKMIYKYESFFNKDVLDFSRSQLIAMFEDLNSTPSTFEQRYRYLKKYFDGYGKKISVIEFGDLDVYQSVRRGSIRDYDEFLYIINNSFRPDELQTLDVIRKTCVILLYLGLSKSEVTEMLKSDVDETAGKITFGESRTVRSDIPSELLEVLKICKQMTQYVNPLQSSERPKDLQQSEYLIRRDSSLGDSEKSPVLFIDKIFRSEVFATVDKELTPTRVIESGLYHWLIKQEKEKFDTKQFRELLKEYFNRDINKYQQYFQNYYSWKKAFDL